MADRDVIATTKNFLRSIGGKYFMSELERGRASYMNTLLTSDRPAAIHRAQGAIGAIDLVKTLIQDVKLSDGEEAK